MAPDLDLRDSPTRYTRGLQTAAGARDVNLKVTMTALTEWLTGPQCWWGRLVLKHGIAAVYLIAFVIAAHQFQALTASTGSCLSTMSETGQESISSGGAIFVSVHLPCDALPLLVLAHWRVNGPPDPNVRRPGLV